MNKLWGFPWIGLLPFAVVAAEKPKTSDAPPVELDKVEVVAVSPLPFSGLDINKIPARVQTISAEDLQASQAISLADHLNRYLGSVHINDAQNNPLQPDVQYRGFSASPLMGLPQGLAVYVNGVRFNEPFGDMVQWDLLPQGAIDHVALQPATNPAFGQNALGGALTIQTKTGFTSPKHTLEAQGGSWDRHSEELTSGWNNGTFGYFVDFNYFSEAGWRDHSGSEAKRGLGTLSWRNGETSSLDVTLAGAENTLRGNGTVPQELLALGRSQVFTHPDITRNRLFLVSLDGDHWLDRHNQLSGTAYYRRNKISTFNGDGSEFNDCEIDGVDFLCEEGESTPARALDGSHIEADDVLEGGTINTSETTQQSFGFALQNAFHHRLLGRDNRLVAGVSYDHSTAHYRADTELGSLTADRGVAPGGVWLYEARVRLNTETNSYGVFLTDTWSLTDKLDVTVSGRYNIMHLELKDHFPGDDPEENLSGYHTFNRINPAAGLTYAFMPELIYYANYSESSRAPTPMELGCANPNAPCKLPNAFVSDPPLAQVVTNSWESGFRGRIKHVEWGYVDWHAGFFHITNNNDIIFQAQRVGGGGTRGYFENVGKTLRQGAEAGLSGEFFDRWRWSANYSYIDATYQASFESLSHAHPEAIDDVIQVRPGHRIPSIPAHQAKFSTDVDIVPEWTLGFDMHYNSGQYLRGDEANLTPKLPAFVVFNLRSEYRFNEHIALFGRVNNLFDRDYANFGALANTGEVLEGVGIPEQNSRFLGVAAPRAAWIGVRLTM